MCLTILGHYALKVKNIPVSKSNLDIFQSQLFCEMMIEIKLLLINLG